MNSTEVFTKLTELLKVWGQFEVVKLSDDNKFVVSYILEKR
jgi:hypothetical protein